MARREAERLVEALLDGYQEVLDEAEAACVEDVPLDDESAAGEAWLLRDASIARIDGIREALELLGYAVARGRDGGWRVRRSRR